MLEPRTKHYAKDAKIDFLVKLEAMIKEAKEELWLRRANEVRHDTDPEIVEWFNQECAKLDKILETIHE